MIFDTSNYQQTWADIKQLASTKFDLIRVGLLEKLAKIAGLVLFALAIILLLFAIISFGCLSLIYAIGQTLPMWAAALIVVTLWLLIMIGAIAFRKQLFINPMIAAISAILFAPMDDTNKPAVSNQPAAEQTQPTEGKEVRHE